MDASFDGRAYGGVGGVSKAIEKAIKAMDPTLEVKAVQGNGIKECSRLLQELEDGQIEGNFMEGMGCPGGCVGGPGRNVSAEEGRERMEAFAREAYTEKSFENEAAIRWENALTEQGVMHSEKVKMKSKAK